MAGGPLAKVPAWIPATVHRAPACRSLRFCLDMELYVADRLWVHTIQQRSNEVLGRCSSREQRVKTNFSCDVKQSPPRLAR